MERSGKDLEGFEMGFRGSLVGMETVATVCRCMFVFVREWVDLVWNSCGAVF